MNRKKPDAPDTSIVAPSNIIQFSCVAFHKIFNRNAGKSIIKPIYFVTKRKKVTK